MSKYTLVAANLSSVFPASAQVTTHPVPTSRRDIPLPSVRTTIPGGHASHSSLFNSPKTGHVLVRLVQDDLAVELVSLSTNVSPVCFLFPATVVPSPSLVVLDDELHILAATSVGSLFRLVLPLYEGGQLWHDPFGRDWCREWQIKKLTTTEAKLVHVLDFNLIAVGLGTGGYVRLESDGVSSHEQWSEVEYKHNNWYSSLLPVLPGSSLQPNSVVSLASVPPPTDVIDVFTISRDRTLRRWTAAKGCRTEISLTAGISHSSSSDKQVSLLDDRPQKLLQAFTESRVEGRRDAVEDHFLLVFLPTPWSSAAGGYFQLYHVDDYRWDVVAHCSTSENSALCKMQDFIYDSGNLYVLWEKQGESILEVTQLNHGDFDCSLWTCAVYGRNSEVTEATMDELLLQPGSLTDKFLQTVMRPGVFSALTLRQALHDYKEHYLSLPGAHASALAQSCATLSESIAAVVGSSVELAHDPQTGFALHKQYRNALRRDWEGFIARCKEIERSARWPVALGLGGGKGQILILERERIGQCVEEDKPMETLHNLSDSPSGDPSINLIATGWLLRERLPVQLTRRIENEMLNILGQEISFPLADIIIEASNRVFSREDIEDELDAWVTSRLSSIDGFDQTVRLVLDAITGLDKSVKQEEDEVELIIPPETAEWSRALITTYVTESIEIRYKLCVALAVLLFFVGEDLRRSDPALLAEVFAVFRGAAMFRSLVRQTAGDLDGSRPGHQEPEDVVTRLNNLHMSRGGRNLSPTYSLVHQLVSQSGHPSLIPAAAHFFIEQVGLLSLDSPSHASKSEVFLCERLRLLGYRECTRQLLAWLPRTPAVCYVFGRLWVDAGRGDDAIPLFRGVAGSFGPDFALTNEEVDALSSVLPSGVLFPSEFDYYLHVADVYRSCGMSYEEVSFTKLALSVLPEGENPSELWGVVIKGYTDLGLYDQAYVLLMASPFPDSRQQYVSNLVYKMCEDEALDQLLSMHFKGFEQEVESSLSFKARNADPRTTPNYSHILYTWYTNRGDFRNAALTMYTRSRKLSELPADLASSSLYGEQRLESLIVATNALRLLDQKNAWILVPSPASAIHPRKRRKIEQLIPEDKFTAGLRDVDVVTVNEIEQEYIVLNATLALLRRDSSALRLTDGTPSPWLVVSKLTQSGQFDLAMQTAKALSVDLTETFQRLALQCLRLSSTPESSIMEVGSADWLLTDKVSSWPGSPADRGWRYLRQCLDRYDNAEIDFQYSKGVLDTLLSHDQSSSPPPWLMQNIEEHHPDHLVRSYLRYGMYEEALSLTLQLVRKSTTAWNKTSAVQPSQTWLPYALIDAVLKSSEEGLSEPARNIRNTLQNEVKQRILRIQTKSGKAP